MFFGEGKALLVKVSSNTKKTDTDNMNPDILYNKLIDEKGQSIEIFI